MVVGNPHRQNNGSCRHKPSSWLKTREGDGGNGRRWSKRQKEVVVTEGGRGCGCKPSSFVKVTEGGGSGRKPSSPLKTRDGPGHRRGGKVKQIRAFDAGDVWQGKASVPNSLLVTRNLSVIEIGIALEFDEGY